MKENYLKKVEAFDIDSLPDLDEIVLASLQFFSDFDLLKIDTKKYSKPLVIGSVNAFQTGKILFKEVDAVFADSGSYKDKLSNVGDIDSVYIISASGGKHATEIAQEISKLDVPLFLITNNLEASAAKYVEQGNIFIFPHIREPYTYNTSTYMSMMLGSDNSISSKQILEYLESNIFEIDFNKLSEMEAFTLIVPTSFDIIKNFFETKFDELFQPKLSGRSFNIEEIKHAKTVIDSDKEFFISFGVENNYYGEEKNRLFIPIPQNCTPATFMAIGYYVIGQIQKLYPPFFKNEIVEYAKEASEIFDQEINPIVE